jgi:DNA replication protein DnaC
MISGDSKNPILDFVPLRFRGAVLEKLGRGLQAEIAAGDRNGLVFNGPTGVGKTFAMAAIANVGRLPGEPAARGWVDWTEFCRDVRSAWALHNLDDRRRFDPISWAVRTPMLYVDDLGQEKDERGAEFFSSIVNGRYENERTMCVTTNLTDEEFLRYGGRTVSRLREMCSFLELSGDDRRLAVS